MDLCGKKNGASHDAAQDRDGAAWVWAGVDAKTRLILHVFPGDRTEESCRTFLKVLVCRLDGNKPLFTSDELASYATVLKELYHQTIEQERTGLPGRPKNPRVEVDTDLDYATVHKTREKGHVVKVEKKVVYGDSQRIAIRLEQSPSNTINTSYIERVNGILRQMDAHLRRKAPTFAKAMRYLTAKLHLVVAFYNFVRPHGTLSRNPDRTTTPRTPAMIAGLSDHLWTVEELLALARVPQ
jgi:IS1 family transposase